MKSLGCFLLSLFVGCGYGPSGPPLTDLEAGYTVRAVDSLTSEVTFIATAPDTLWWKVVWQDFTSFDALLWSYGTGVRRVSHPVLFDTGFRFWLDFTAWTRKDTVVVTYMSPGG